MGDPRSRTYATPDGVVHVALDVRSDTLYNGIEMHPRGLRYEIVPLARATACEWSSWVEDNSADVLILYENDALRESENRADCPSCLGVLHKIRRTSHL